MAKVSDPPTEVRAKVRASHAETAAKAKALQLSLVAPEPAEVPFPNDPPAAMTPGEAFRAANIAALRKRTDTPVPDALPADLEWRKTEHGYTFSSGDDIMRVTEYQTARILDHALFASMLSDITLADHLAHFLKSDGPPTAASKYVQKYVKAAIKALPGLDKAARTQSSEGPHAPLVVSPAYASPVDYHALPHLSATDIRRGYHTPEAALWYRLHPPEPSPYMQNGTALHLAVLEPERFAREVVAKPEGMTFATKEGKEWRAQHEGLLIVSADLYARAAVYAAKSAAVLQHLGATAPRFEHPVLWTDPVAGDCRCKPDCYWLDADGIPHLASVKTTAKPMTATEWAATLASTPRGPGYDVGEYHYARGLAAVYLGDADRWAEVVIHHVVLSTEGPPQIAIWELGAAILQRASTIWLDKAPRIAAAVSAPLPDVIVMGGTIVDVPRWAAMPATEEEA